MSDRFRVISSSSRAYELCGGVITRTLAIEVAQRVLVESPRARSGTSSWTATVEVDDVGGWDCSFFGIRAHPRL